MDCLINCRPSVVTCVLVDAELPACKAGSEYPCDMEAVTALPVAVLGFWGTMVVYSSWEKLEFQRLDLALFSVGLYPVKKKVEKHKIFSPTSQ